MDPQDPRWNGLIFIGIIAMIVAYFGVRAYNRSHYPLHQAVIEGDVDKMLELTKKFFHNSSELDKTDGSGQTPLFLAISGISKSQTMEHRLTMIRILLNSGADLNKKAGNGGTALHTAVYWCSGKVRYPDNSVVKELLAAGADPSVRNNEGKSPIDLAIEYKNTELAELLKTYQAARNKTIIQSGTSP